MKRVQALYSGSVQGVGFRFTAIDAAQQHGLTGWVRNTPDGKVELVAEGEEDRLRQFLSDIESAMANYISGKKFSWEPATREFVNFRISY
ncbi:acylphosphatase [Candidatus Margulisiibacteriota bacterium]